MDKSTDDKKMIPDIEYSEGMDARFKNKTSAENPYAAGSPEFNRWLAGYLDADEDFS